MGSLLRKVIAALLAPAAALAAGGDVFVADSRRFTGWRAWITNLYNDDLLYFALVTIAVILLTAMALGAITSYLLGRLGVDLKNHVSEEH